MDNGLLTTVPRLAMQQLREAKQALGPASTINAEVTIRGGSTDLHLQFSDATEASAFVERLGAIEVPSTLTYSRFDAASGALEFIDLNTGHQLNPEVRYYQAKRAGEPPPQTTEAAISSMVYEDLYLAMKDMGGMINTLGQPVINLMVVIFPFVAFLWTGGIVLVFGTLICVTPRWLGRTFIDLFRPRHRAGAARVLGAGLAVLLVALFSAQALASESASDKVDAHHHAEQPDVSVEQLLSVLRCPCPSLGGGLEERDDSLAASSCDCARAVLERQVVSEVRESEAAAAGSVSFHAVLERLVALDASWDHRILFDETTFRDLVMSTKTTCPGERGLVLGQAQITCSVRNLWFPRFRQMLASGMSVDAVRRVYVQEENQSSRAPPGGWSYEDLRADPDKPMAWIFPTGVLLGVLGMFLGIRLRRARAKTPVSERRARPMTGLNASDRLRLEDELDAL